MYNVKNRNRGARESGLRGSNLTSTLKPDLGNANVGSDIICLYKEIP